MIDWNREIIAEFRANNGDVATAGFGRSLILVHHIGAQSGLKRVNPLRAVHNSNGTWLVVASKQGAPENPDWYYNLKKNPHATIETPADGMLSVRVEILSGEDREEAWQAFIAENPVFAEYQQKTDRQFPVLALHKVE